MADVTHKDKFVVEPDREAAIRQAILFSHEGDYVVIAGKGHETTQSKNGIEYPFSDRAIASNYLQLGAIL
jgi:UDP-N-acetylmuramoyl-L-alanyl-D-glutamate--2,6-diaminopimelate ligase